MKLFAQHGYGDGDKIWQGLEEKIIQGAIISPRDYSPEKAQKRIGEFASEFPKAELLLDPQLYASLFANISDVRLGKLEQWDHFSPHRRSELEDEDAITKAITDCFKVQESLDVTHVVSPNIYIGSSFNSIEAGIAKRFIKKAATLYGDQKDNRKLFISLAISREALLQQSEFDSFLHDITSLKNKPSGFYLIVGANAVDSRSDIFHTDVICNWMMLNHALSLNGYDVVNGYSDVLTPLLGIAGGAAGATGWWSNLRTFSLERFMPSQGGGRLPVLRYLTQLLLSRVAFYEKESFHKYLPKILNKLPHDRDYDPDPARKEEVLQSWEALNSLNKIFKSSSIDADLRKIEKHINKAQAAYTVLNSEGISIDKKSRGDHLTAMLDAIHSFRDRAEI